jgi:hypothetical protein
LYGIVIGIIFGLGVYLLTGAASALGFVTVAPEILGGLVFAVCTIAGPGMAYGDWIEDMAQGSNNGSKAPPQ